MSEYETKAVTIGDITVTISKAKSPNAVDRIEAVLEFLSDRIVDPGYGVGGSPRPDQGLPGGGTKPVDPGYGVGGSPRPDQGLPGEKLAKFVKEHSKEIALAILKGTACDPAKPK